MDNNTVQGLPHVEATLNYVAAGAERPVSYAYTPPPVIPGQGDKDREGSD